MDTKVLTLTEFLLARLDEQRTECDGTGEYSGCWNLSEFAEQSVAAMRRIVGIWSLQMSEPEDDYPTGPIGGEGAEVYYEVLQHLALPYADHPDYREEWKP
jgi:hypothetical protein